MLFEHHTCNTNASLYLDEIAAWPLNYRMSLISALHCVQQRDIFKLIGDELGKLITKKLQVSRQIHFF